MFETSLDESTWLAATGDLIVDTPGVYLRSTDGVGNRSTEHATWDLDVAAPELFLVDMNGVEHAPGTRFEAANGDVLKIKVVDDGCLVPTVEYRYEDGRAISARGRQIPVDREHCFIRPFVDRYCRITVDAVDQFGRESSASWKVGVERQSEGGDS